MKDFLFALNTCPKCNASPIMPKDKHVNMQKHKSKHTQKNIMIQNAAY